MLATLREMVRLPGVQIVMSGDNACRAAYRSFTAGHPRFPLIQSKRWGVALLEVPPSLPGYLDGRSRQALRTNRRRALRAGFSVEHFEPGSALTEIMEINRSLESRQGRPVNPAYLEPDAVRRYFGSSPKVLGVKDSAGRLRAYLDLRVCGEVAVVSRLFGHGDVLEQGVMYLLVSEAIRETSAMRVESGSPSWLMYDTFPGASPGLRYFKERLGFAPYRVRWMWRDG